MTSSQFVHAVCPLNYWFQNFVVSFVIQSFQSCPGKSLLSSDHIYSYLDFLTTFLFFVFEYWNIFLFIVSIMFYLEHIFVYCISWGSTCFFSDGLIAVYQSVFKIYLKNKSRYSLRIKMPPFSCMLGHLPEFLWFFFLLIYLISSILTISIEVSPYSFLHLCWLVFRIIFIQFRKNNYAFHTGMLNVITLSL